MDNVFEAAFLTVSDATEDGPLDALEVSFGLCDTGAFVTEPACCGQEDDTICPILPTPSINSPPAHTTADHDSSAGFGSFDQLKVTFNWQRGTLLGTGASGSVHTAIVLDDPAQPEMAVKEIPIQEASCLPHIQNEINVMCLLEHENVVKLLGTDRQAGSIFLFQELCDGGTLARAIARAEEQDSRIEEVLIQMYTIHLLEAIQYIHSEGVVHRDIKPESELPYFTWLNVY